MNLSARLRLLLGRLPSGLLVLAAALGFFVLTQGLNTSATPVIGYAEAVTHSVGPLQAGRLSAVTAQLGQVVRAGTVLARLDARPLELARDRRLAELFLARARLAAERDIQDSQLQRGQAQAVRLHAAEEKARAELEELEGQLRRLQGLSGQQLVRAAEIEAVRQKQRAVAAELAARALGNKREQEKMGLRPRTEEEQRHRLSLRLEPIAAAVHVQEAALAEAEYALAQTTLVAPVDGTVGAVLQRPGDVLAAGAPVVTLVTARPGRVVAYVPERLARGLSLGMKVKLRRGGPFRGAVLPGEVVELAPQLEEVPVRARRAPTLPTWARRVTIQVAAVQPLLAGEAFVVTLH